jgi:hypothetical protein
MPTTWMTMTLNPKDPLLTTVPDPSLTLFKLMGKIAGGTGTVVDGRAAPFPIDAVVGAAANIIVNALRQVNPTKEKAETAIDELFGRTKQILMNHYDQLGRLRGIFPYDQHIHVEAVLIDKDKDFRH